MRQVNELNAGVTHMTHLALFVQNEQSINRISGL